MVSSVWDLFIVFKASSASSKSKARLPCRVPMIHISSSTRGVATSSTTSSTNRTFCCSKIRAMYLYSS